jgi:hypothetical protein
MPKTEAGSKVLLDDILQFNAVLEKYLEDNPDDKELKSIQEYLVDRYATFVAFLQ